jgi:hypothetical protein
MYSIDGLEFTMTCIVLIGYISGKVWMYYCIDKDTKKPNKENKGVIRRGNEWD